MNLILRTAAVVVLMFVTILANAQSFQWAKSITGDGFDQAFDLVTDANGNVYVTGQMEYLTDFGNGVTLESEGGHDIFLAKYNSAGDLVWAKRAGGYGGDKAQSVTLDDLGHVYIVGEIYQIANFDNIIKTTTGVNNMFVAQYDTAGNAQWVTTIGTVDTLNTRGYSVSCDNAGNIFVGGATQGSTFYNGMLLFNTRGSTINYDGTFFKFDPQGNMIWARQIASSSTDRVFGVVADDNGFVYATGLFTGRGYFSPVDSISAAGRTDVFLAKYDTAGNLQWVRAAGDTSTDRGWDITINTNNDIIVTGEFSGRAMFGGNQAFSNGLTDMFLAAYDSGGNNLWVISGGGTEDDIGRGVAHDQSGNLYVIGDYGGAATFPPFNVTGNGFAEAYVASYNSSGTALLSLRSFGGYENDRGRGVGTDPAGNVYICGEYVDAVDFDAIHLQGDSLLDIYISKLGPGSACSVSITGNGAVSCNSACDGVAVASAIGQGPFNFMWNTNPPQMTATAVNLCARSYTVVASDALGCTSSASVIISEPDPLLITANIVDAGCNGCNNGSIDLSVTGGNPGYTFAWSNGDTSASISGLEAGQYSVCVTDFNNCQLCDSFIVSEPTGLPVALLDNGFFVHPNPFESRLVITFSSAAERHAYIVNAIGQTVLSEVLKTNENTLFTGHLESGVYYLIMEEKGVRAALKLLKY